MKEASHRKFSIVLFVPFALSWKTSTIKQFMVEEHTCVRVIKKKRNDYYNSKDIDSL